MSGAIHLTITTPSSVLVDEADVRSVRAEDDSGGFGVLPGHADLLTVLPASVVRWRAGDGKWRFCAVHGGVLSVAGGRAVSVACRQGTVGDELARLEAEVRALGSERAEADRQARVEQTRLQARVVRQLMHYLQPGAPGDGPPAAPEEPAP